MNDEPAHALRKSGIRVMGEMCWGTHICVFYEAEQDLLPLCRKEEIGFLAYSPLGAGFLTGKYSGKRDELPPGSRFHVIPGHMDVYFGDEQFRAVEKLRAASERLHIPATQLAIAWVLARPEVTTVLCGARSRSHIDNALAAAELQWDGGSEFTGETPRRRD